MSQEAKTPGELMEWIAAGAKPPAKSQLAAMPCSEHWEQGWGLKRKDKKLPYPLMLQSREAAEDAMKLRVEGEDALEVVEIQWRIALNCNYASLNL